MAEVIETYAQDIVDTVREPLLILDATLRVRSANRAFYQTFHVSPAETEGRLIYELGNGQWDIPALRTLLEDIVPASSVFNDFELAHDFPAIGRRLMLLNARKLRPGSHAELVVLAMEDVTERRRVEADLKAIETYAQNIVDTVREPLLILDATLRVRSANRAFYQTFHVSPGETEGRLIYELGNGQWDIPDLRRLLEDIVPTSSVFNDFELAHTFPAIGRRVMLLNARKLEAGHHGELLVLAMEDVTDRRRAAEVVDQANARMAKANLRMSRDLKVAAKIQESFLPRALPQVPGTAFAWVYRPCDELGGDGLNVIPLGEGRFGLYVLDVSGHGVASALLSVAMSRVLSAPSDQSSILVRDGIVPGERVITPPAEVADRLNRIFPFDTATEQFATLIYGILDARNGEFRYVSAGHPGPVHLPAGTRPVVLASPGYPIGLAEDAYIERSVRLAVGDRLYLYSDGVPEAMNPVGEPFGEARFLEGIGRGRSEPLQAGVAALLGEIERWRGAANALDDVSILAIEVRAEPIYSTKG